MFSGREEHFHVWAKKVENYVSGVFSNVRRALSFAVVSQDAVTATAVALGVLELEVEMLTEIDGQLVTVLSALADGESFDVVMTAGCDHAFESCQSLSEFVVFPGVFKCIMNLNVVFSSNGNVCRSA